jgi:hypothetical protein
VDNYTPREMLAAIKQAPAPTNFLRGMFVKRQTEHPTSFIEIDVEKGGQEVAAFVSATGPAELIKSAGFTNNVHAIPYTYQEKAFTAADVETRLPGETVYGGMSPKARLDERVGMWLQELRDRNARNIEWQLATAMQTGKVTVDGKGVSYEVNYQMSSSNLITNTAGDVWGSGTEDKIGQLEAMAQLPQNAGAPGLTVIVMGTEAARLWLADANVLKYLDNKRVEMGGINPMVLANQRATFLGDFRRIGLNVMIYSYEAKYRHPTTGVVTPYIGANNIVMGSTAARVEEHYGMIKNLKHGSFVGKEFPDMYIDPNGRAGHMTLESAPLIGFHQPDAFVRLTVKS